MRRLEAAPATRPPRSPRTPTLSSFSQTLSSLRLNLVNGHPRRAAAAAEEGISAAPVPARLSTGSDSARTSSSWERVIGVTPMVVCPVDWRTPSIPEKWSSPEVMRLIS